MTIANGAFWEEYVVLSETECLCQTIHLDKQPLQHQRRRFVQENQVGLISLGTRKSFPDQ